MRIEIVNSINVICGHYTDKPQEDVSIAEFIRKSQDTFKAMMEYAPNRELQLADGLSQEEKATKHPEAAIIMSTYNGYSEMMRNTLLAHGLDITPESPAYGLYTDATYGVVGYTNWDKSLDLRAHLASVLLYMAQERRAKGPNALYTNQAEFENIKRLFEAYESPTHGTVEGENVRASVENPFEDNVIKAYLEVREEMKKYLFALNYTEEQVNLQLGIEETEKAKQA